MNKYKEKEIDQLIQLNKDPNALVYQQKDLFDSS